MDNIWFYTLSTSAQVLASLAGLFAVFVVWKIQDFGKMLFETRLAVIRLLNYISPNTKDYKILRLDILHKMPDQELFKEFDELLSIQTKEPSRISASETIRGDSMVPYSLNEFTKDFYKSQIEKKESILKNLKNILIMNFAVISVCILALTFSNLIYCKFTVLTVISVGVLFCLYLISRGIYKITVK